MKKKKNELLELVKSLLEAYEDSRDNDMNLISRIWAVENPESSYITGLDFLIKVMNSEVSSPESIRRRRQLLQAKHLELRGTKYQERQIYSKKYKDALLKGDYNQL